MIVILKGEIELLAIEVIGNLHWVKMVSNERLSECVRVCVREYDFCTCIIFEYIYFSLITR